MRVWVFSLFLLLMKEMWSRGMEGKESGEVVEEEESIITTYPVGEEEARWTEICIVGREVATMA